MRGLLASFLLAVASLAQADAELMVCFGYGCLAQEPVHYGEAALQAWGRQLGAAASAQGEREGLALVIGGMYRIAGEQTPIHNDRGGNLADEAVYGRMDCIDHSRTTGRMLQLLAERGALRWHRPASVQGRSWLGIIESHYSAAIEENGTGSLYVVDSWFVDNGKPAVILPLEDWKKGAGPDV